MPWTVAEDEYIHLPGTQVVVPNTRRKLVKVECSCRYNGGTSFTDMNGVDQWAKGFKVGPPVVPDGYKLVSLACGANLMAHPPLLEMLLVKL